MGDIPSIITDYLVINSALIVTVSVICGLCGLLSDWSMLWRAIKMFGTGLLVMVIAFINMAFTCFDFFRSLEFMDDEKAKKIYYVIVILTVLAQIGNAYYIITE